MITIYTLLQFTGNFDGHFILALVMIIDILLIPYLMLGKIKR